MVALGNKREKHLLKSHNNLRRIAKLNHAKNVRHLKQMAARFQSRVASIRKRMAADRAHQDRMLKQATGKLYAALAKQQEKMESANAKNAKAIRRMRLDQMDRLREMKASFIKRFHSLGSKVAKNNRKFSGSMDKLTGVVRANAIKSAEGRSQLRRLQKSQQEHLKGVLAKAVHRGESLARKADVAIKKLDKKTRATVSLKVSQEVAALARSTKNQLNALSFENAQARAQLRKEMVYAVKSAASVAKADLKVAVTAANKNFAALKKESAQKVAHGKASRAAVERRLKAAERKLGHSLQDAVANQNRALLAYRTETSKRIKASNKKITAASKQLEKNAAIAKAQMKSMIGSITTKIKQARKQARESLAASNAADVKRHTAALKFTETSLKRALNRSNKKFGKLYKDLAKDRKRAERGLSGAVTQLNQHLAKQSALEDSRFRKTVKNIAAARAEATRGVMKARHAFTVGLASTRSFAKNVETRVRSEIAVVSSEVQSNRIFQARVNRNVAKELKRIVGLSNQNQAESKRARGKIRALMNKNKKLASMAVGALAKRTNAGIYKLHHKLAEDKRGFQIALTKSTKRLYGHMADLKKYQDKQNGKISSATAAAAVASAAAVKRARAEFGSKLTSLTNVVTSNAQRYRRGLDKMAGVVGKMIQKDKAGRALFRQQSKAMQSNLQRSLTRAVQLGEAKMKATEDRINAKRKKMKKDVSSTLAASCERMADSVYAALNPKRRKIASNYLNLKGYASAARDAIFDKVKPHRRSMQSIGDLLLTVAYMSKIRPKPSPGLAMGNPKITQLFSGKKIKMKNTVSKINGLVDEYTQLMVQVRARWPFGIGKYFLNQVDRSMMGKGILEVSSIGNKPGKHVFINAHAVGLSATVADFKKISTPMKTYSAALVALTKKASKYKKSHAVHTVKDQMKAPEWNGN